MTPVVFGGGSSAGGLPLGSEGPQVSLEAGWWMSGPRV